MMASAKRDALDPPLTGRQTAHSIRIPVEAVEVSYISLMGVLGINEVQNR